MKSSPASHQNTEGEKPNMKTRKLWFLLACVCLGIAGAAPAFAQFPERPVTMFIPYSPGGATDGMFRALAQAARKYFPHPIVVENRPGGSGAVALQAMIAQKPDGYIVTAIVPVVQRASYQSKFAFDVVKDIIPFIQVGGLQYGIVVRPDSPHRKVSELLAFAKANPGKFSYMSAGIGSGGHIYMEELAVAAGGIKFIHVPSKGDADAAAGLLGGHVDSIAVTPGGWSSLVQAGRLRLLATLGEARTKRFPNVPTVKEEGYNVVHLTPLGLSVPRGTPQEIVRNLHDRFRQAMNDPEFTSYMDDRENSLMYLGTEAYVKAWADSYVMEGKRAQLLSGN
jgi:tripartite-type tricarboxylate transporter receptor subunit TctC